VLPNPATESLDPRVKGLLCAWEGHEAFDAALRTHPEVCVYLAGGALRDLLLGKKRTPRDFDFFISGPRVDSFLDRLSADGELRYGPFGSPRWFPHSASATYADVIPITAFYNGLEKCRNIIEVLQQFDFTANAIAVDLRTSAFFDPIRGLRDLRSGVIRAVRFDYPDEPISPGLTLTRLSVLWMRLVHYASTLRFDIAPDTLQWLRANAYFGSDANAFTQVFFKPDTAHFCP
jgi:hypothetical protein